MYCSLTMTTVMSLPG